MGGGVCLGRKEVARRDVRFFEIFDNRAIEEDCATGKGKRFLQPAAQDGEAGNVEAVGQPCERGGGDHAVTGFSGQADHFGFKVLSDFGAFGGGNNFECMIKKRAGEPEYGQSRHRGHRGGKGCEAKATGARAAAVYRVAQALDGFDHVVFALGEFEGFARIAVGGVDRGALALV